MSLALFAVSDAELMEPAGTNSSGVGFMETMGMHLSGLAFKPTGLNSSRFEFMKPRAMNLRRLQFMGSTSIISCLPVYQVPSRNLYECLLVVWRQLRTQKRRKRAPSVSIIVACII